jgi:hypothetical protein
MTVNYDTTIPSDQEEYYFHATTDTSKDIFIRKTTTNLIEVGVYGSIVSFAATLNSRIPFISVSVVITLSGTSYNVVVYENFIEKQTTTISTSPFQEVLTQVSFGQTHDGSQQTVVILLDRFADEYSFLKSLKKSVYQDSKKPTNTISPTVC